MRASGYDRDEDDWYVEPPSCVAALASVEKFEGSIWDPACGGGNIPITLSAVGATQPGEPIIGSDIVDRANGRFMVDNFWTTNIRADNIVCNPPYKDLQSWVDRALSITPRKVCILARLAFLEGQVRREWFQSSPLARVWVSSKRLSMPPGRSSIPAKGGAIAYAWFVFEQDHEGPPTLGWI